MTDLAHLFDLTKDQDAGLPLAIKHPVTGERLDGLTLIVAGPDSSVQARARHEYTDALIRSENRAPSEMREKWHTRRIARSVVGWTAKVKGEDVPFTLDNVIDQFTRLPFVQDQVEAFGRSRDGYFLALPFEEDAA